MRKLKQNTEKNTDRINKISDEEFTGRKGKKVVKRARKKLKKHQKILRMK